jgi:glucuronoarabinoxylan endo-1,4-beta-xylanase
MYQWKLPKYAYVLGNYSKFVRPGYKMVAIDNENPGGDWEVKGKGNNTWLTAFKDDASNRRVIVAINTRSSGYTLTINGMKGIPYVTGYRTSANEGLKNIGTYKVKSGSLSVILNPQSVTTFVGTARKIK